jgi:hypothetical protein
MAEVEHLVRRLPRHRLALEDAQHGVAAPRGGGRDRVVEQRRGGVGLDAHAGDALRMVGRSASDASMWP